MEITTSYTGSWQDWCVVLAYISLAGVVMWRVLGSQ